MFKHAASTICVFVTLFVVVVACGRLNDKFGRSKSDYTQVQFQTKDPASGGPSLMASQYGGMMVYFARSGSDTGGNAFGFANEDAAVATPVSLPNGSYKVYAFSYAGANVAEGQVRCGFGNGGADVNLVGGAAVVSITLNLANCTFGSDGPFSSALGSDASSSTNFDALSLYLCDTYPSSCTTSTSSTHYFRFRILGGIKPDGSGTPIIVAPQITLATSCTSIAGGVANTNVRIPVGHVGGTAGISAPLDVQFFSDSGCTNLVASYDLSKGLSDFTSVASTSTVYVSSPATDNSSYLKLYRTF